MTKSRRIAAGCIAAAFLGSSGNASAASAARLEVHENRRYLQYENGKPFLYLGDTAWELFHRLNREEATQYLTNRAQKGFTVIQAVVLAPARRADRAESVRRPAFDRWRPGAAQ